MEMKYYFNGIIANNGKGPIAFDIEKVVLKPNSNGKCFNIAAEISFVNGTPDYDLFFHSYIFHKHENILSYNEWINKLTRYKLNFSPPIEFVRNQIRHHILRNQPLLIGCNVRNDLNSINIEYDNYFDIQNFFYEYNDLKTGFQPISLRRLVKKFYNLDILFKLERYFQFSFNRLPTI
jgi:hypothetical protein